MLGVRLSIFFGELMLAVIGWIFYAWWFLFTRWYIPKDMLHRSLEYNSAVMQVLYKGRNEKRLRRYTRRQDWRRGRVEIRQMQRDMAANREIIREKNARGAYTEGLGE
jgi:hypothetical protein